MRRAASVIQRMNLHSPELWVPRRFQRTYNEEHHAHGLHKGAWCALCGCQATREYLDDGGDKRIDYVVECHGAKEARRLYWDSETETKSDAIRRVIEKPFFDPLPEGTNAATMASSNAA